MENPSWSDSGININPYWKRHKKINLSYSSLRAVAIHNLNSVTYLYIISEPEIKIIKLIERGIEMMKILTLRQIVEELYDEGYLKEDAIIHYYSFSKDLRLKIRKNSPLIKKLRLPGEFQYKFRYQDKELVKNEIKRLIKGE